MPLRKSTVRMPASATGVVCVSHAADNFGQEVGARRARLGEDLVAPVAVVADRGSGDEHACSLFAARDRAGEQCSAAYPALANAALLFFGPAFLADAFTGEVHDRTDTFERGRVDAPFPRVPSDIEVAGRGTAHKAPNPVAAAAQHVDERTPDQAVRSADDHIHPMPPRSDGNMLTIRNRPSR